MTLFQMRGRALALAEGAAARDGGAFGTATAPFALFPALAVGGGGCFLLLAVAAVEEAAAAFDLSFLVSFSSSSSSPSSPPPPSSVFFCTPGQNAVVLPPTLIQRIPCPSCVALCDLSSHRW